MVKKMTPEEFAAAENQARERKCWACTLPELADLNRAHDAGVTTASLERWLIQVRGYPSKNYYNRLKRHFDHFA